MLTKYGTDNIIIMLFGGFIAIIVGIIFRDYWTSYLFYFLGILLIIFTLYFFRDPKRIIATEALIDESILVAPADGKIVGIIEVEEKYYLKSKAIQISIFLSPLDVHVNRSPISGKVEYYSYFEGEYLVAYHPKSSEKNEHSKIGVKNNFGRILFKQIVGILARRIVCTVKEGDSLKVGEKIGMMKFGSRMDIIVSPNTEILIKNGDRVVAGESIIAKLKKN